MCEFILNMFPVFGMLRDSWVCKMMFTVIIGSTHGAPISGNTGADPRGSKGRVSVERRTEREREWASLLRCVFMCDECVIVTQAPQCDSNSTRVIYKWAMYKKAQTQTIMCVQVWCVHSWNESEYVWWGWSGGCSLMMMMMSVCNEVTLLSLHMIVRGMLGFTHNSIGSGDN